MRTTLTLDNDVAAQLRRLRERDERPFKQLVNDVMRAGLTRVDEPEQHQSRGPYTRAVSLGEPRLADIDDVGEALAIAEGERYR